MQNIVLFQQNFTLENRKIGYEHLHLNKKEAQILSCVYIFCVYIFSMYSTTPRSW